MKEIIKELRRPFRPSEVQYKIQAAGPKGVVCVAYIDARHVSERLNYIVCKFPGFAWGNTFHTVHEGDKLKGIECEVKLVYNPEDGSSFEATHEDVGAFDNVNEEQHGLKAVYSDAFKRAAVHCGIGVSLYSHPFSFISYENRDSIRWKNEKAVGLTDQGELRLRKTYAKWLEKEGIKKFGTPIVIDEE